MANNADRILVGATGQVYVAPVGTAAPTDVTTALNAAFIDLGYIGDGGLEVSPSMESVDIQPWQSFYSVRQIITARAMMIGFELLEWSKQNLPFAMGGGAVSTTGATHKYTPPALGAIDYRAMVVHWVDGTKIYRLVVPKGQAVDLGASSLTRTDKAGLTVSFKVTGTDGTDPWLLYTNDAAFA